MEKAKKYSELDDLDEVVVQVGPKMEIVGGEAVEVPGTRREIVMTKAGFEAQPKGENGKYVHAPVKLLGYPDYDESNQRVAPYRIIEFSPEDEAPKGRRGRESGKSGDSENA